MGYFSGLDIENQEKQEFKDNVSYARECLANDDEYNASCDGNERSYIAIKYFGYERMKDMADAKFRCIRDETINKVRKLLADKKNAKVLIVVDGRNAYEIIAEYRKKLSMFNVSVPDYELKNGKLYSVFDDNLNENTQILIIPYAVFRSGHGSPKYRRDNKSIFTFINKSISLAVSDAPAKYNEIFRNIKAKRVTLVHKADVEYIIKNTILDEIGNV